MKTHHGITKIFYTPPYKIGLLTVIIVQSIKNAPLKMH
jgi:hypothetical protein